MGEDAAPARRGGESEVGTTDVRGEPLPDGRPGGRPLRSSGAGEPGVACVAVKICGVTREHDALHAVELGATHLGLNFWERSPRRVELAAARRIADAVRGRAALVGVFVDPDVDALLAAAGEVGLDLLQLHGDEAPPFLLALEDELRARTLKAFRGDELPGARELHAWESCWGYLLEGRHPAYGGAGERWGWQAAAAFAPGKPWFLAGGIGPDNVAEALGAARPWGVDVCSGVEASPGVKDPARLARLFAEIARHARHESRPEALPE